jgi:hypothetical protein
VGAVEEEEVVVRLRRGKRNFLSFCSEDAECVFYYAGVSTGHPKWADTILVLQNIVRPIFVTQIMTLSVVHVIHKKVII